MLYAVSIAFVSPYAFRVDLSIFFFFSVIVGGSGRLVGPVIGTAILYLVPNALLADLASYRLLAYGAVALVIMLAFPDGVVGTLENARRSATGQGRARPGSISRRVLRESAAAPQDTAPPIGITVRGARKAYGKMVALNGVDVDGRAAARSTPSSARTARARPRCSMRFRASPGSTRARSRSRASIRRDGRPIDRARLGLGRTFQTPRVFEDMSIWDNLRIGADSGRRRSPVLAAEVLRAAPRALGAPRMPDTLPHAQRRLLEVLRVLAMDSKILLLDEPAAGLSTEERHDLAELLRMARDTDGHARSC